MRELAVACSPGVGHINPNTQLAREIAARSAEVHITLFVPVCEWQRDVLRQLVIERSEQTSDMPAGLKSIVHASMSLQIDLVVWHMYGENDLREVMVRFCKLQALSDGRYWTDLMAAHYASMDAKPACVLSDIMVIHGFEYGRQIGVPCWHFNPSPSVLPLLYDHLSYTFAHPEETYHAQIPGLGEINVAELMIRNDVPGVEYLVPSFTKYLKIQNRYDGVLCNDLDFLYPSETREACQKKFNHNLHYVGAIRPSFDIQMRASDEVLSWLSQFADETVIYVSFGSMFNPARGLLLRICKFLARLPYYVLWSLRSPYKSCEGYDAVYGLPQDCLPLKNIKIVDWVNQPAVLQHRAVGAFLTHCGWNSIMESVSTGGKPIICCPLAAEQYVNAYLVLNVFGNGIGLNNGRSGLKPENEMISSVISLMDPKSRERIKGNRFYMQAKASKIHLDAFMNSVIRG